MVSLDHSELKQNKTLRIVYEIYYLHVHSAYTIQLIENL